MRIESNGRSFARRAVRVASAALLLGAAQPAALTPGKPLGPKDIDKLAATAPTVVARYGEGERQFGELRLPEGKGPFPVAIVIHGGCWTKGYATARNTAALASALTARGIATWNIEYRQVGEAGGGWPGTYRDWAAAADQLRVLARGHRLDLDRVITVGHSAGAHAALWIAARHRLPAGSEIGGARPLPVHAAVAIDGPADIARFVGPDAKVCGRPVIAPLMGGTPAEQPRRYAQGSPAALFPIGRPQWLVQSSVLRADDADAYRGAAAKAGDAVTVIAIPGGTHFNMIAPADPSFAAVTTAVDAALASVRKRR